MKTLKSCVTAGMLGMYLACASVSFANAASIELAINQVGTQYSMQILTEQEKIKEFQFERYTLSQSSRYPTRRLERFNKIQPGYKTLLYLSNDANPTTTNGYRVVLESPTGNPLDRPSTVDLLYKGELPEMLLASKTDTQPAILEVKAAPGQTVEVEPIDSYAFHAINFDHASSLAKTTSGDHAHLKGREGTKQEQFSITLKNGEKVIGKLNILLNTSITYDTTSANRAGWDGKPFFSLF